MNNSEAVRKLITGTAIPLVGNDIDTDRIIPARFLRCVTFEGLGEHVFSDERYDADGNSLPHPFNDSRFGGGSILIVNRNFGCGSSREHAPQSLMRAGVTAIIGESFAEIFAGNCTSLGIPVCTAGKEAVRKLQEYVEQFPATIIQLDLERKRAIIDDRSVDLDMAESARSALLGGSWDTLGELSRRSDAISAVHNTLPYLHGFQGDGFAE